MIREPPPTATKPATPIPPATRHEWAALATATLIATLIGILTLHEPPRVDHINIHNTTDYRIYIYASDPAHTSLTQVGIIAPHETRRFDDVLDRGPTWILHFHTQGTDAGTIQLPRHELTAAAPFTIPIEIGRQLEGQQPRSGRRDQNGSS